MISFRPWFVRPLRALELRRGWGLLLSSVLVVLVLGCGKTASEDGGETHFLVPCKDTVTCTKIDSQLVCHEGYCRNPLMLDGGVGDGSDGGAGGTQTAGRGGNAGMAQGGEPSGGTSGTGGASGNASEGGDTAIGGQGSGGDSNEGGNGGDLNQGGNGGDLNQGGNGGDGNQGGTGGVGQCVPGGGCIPTNECHNGSIVCDNGEPTCEDSGAAVENGTSCGTQSVCNAGACTPCNAGDTCVPDDPCRNNGTIACDTGAAICESDNILPDGANCGSNLVCNAGECVACTSGVSCTPANKCHVGESSCDSGSLVCVDTGASLDDGTNCGSNAVCNGGICGACTEGISCVPENVCNSGIVLCDSGVAACVDTGNHLTNGSSCGAGKTCHNGTCNDCTPGGSCVPPSGVCNYGTISCSTGVAVCTEDGFVTSGTSCGTNKVCGDGTCNDCTVGASCTPTTPEGVCHTGVTSCTTGHAQCIDTGARVHDCWEPISQTNAPAGRARHASAWTGSKMIVWGGGITNGETNTGGIYDVATRSWEATWPIGAPDPIWDAKGFWLNEKMYMVGGYVGEPTYNQNHFIVTYDPATYEWNTDGYILDAELRDDGREATAVLTSGGIIFCGQAYGDPENTLRGYGAIFPASTLLADDREKCDRYDHTAVWSGTEMLIYGGLEDASFPLGGGLRYDPSTDTWSGLSPEAPPTYPYRWQHVAVWTGSKMIVWGGLYGPSTSDKARTNTGGIYDPTTDTWVKMSTVNAPEARTHATAVWTGSKMIVYGGDKGTLLNSGAIYDPTSDTWTAISAPPWSQGRIHYTSIWTGEGMLIYGGELGEGGNTYFGDGAIYYP